MPVTYKKRTAGKVTPEAKEKTMRFMTRYGNASSSVTIGLSLLSPRGNTLRAAADPRL